MTSDGDVLEQWWQETLATRRLPAALEVVHARLVRAVGRGQLPSGAVFVKLMTFPRAKDRWRYLFRPLPGAHEAAMLRQVAGAGIPCPEVVDVRTLRKGFRPDVSFLVLRALPVLAANAAAAGQSLELEERARLAVQLLEAGIVHRDLNASNFVRLVDGRLAVLDLQSAGQARGLALAGGRRIMAARLLADTSTSLPTAAAMELLIRAGLVQRRDAEAVVGAAIALRRRWLRSRVLRCLSESTEFTRRVHWNGIEHRRRGELPVGHWHSGGRELLHCWLGERALHVMEGRAPVLFALFRKWKWFPGTDSVYIPAPVHVEIARELTVLSEGYERYRWLLAGGAGPPGWSGRPAHANPE